MAVSVSGLTPGVGVPPGEPVAVQHQPDDRTDATKLASSDEPRITHIPMSSTSPET
jgi:hypothetical protein